MGLEQVIFFYKESKSKKKNLCVWCVCVGGGGGGWRGLGEGARVSECFLQRIHIEN